MKTYFYQFILGITFSFFSLSIYAQEVSGKIIDETTGEGLSGATIVIENTTDTIHTDVNGDFNLTTKETLPFKVIVDAAGYRPKPFTISEETVVIKLESTQIKLAEVTVTSRRRKETAQNIPIPVTVLGGTTVENTGAFNVNRVKELVPSVQLYASNGRNTTLNIRGLGSTFGLTNDGIDPGVGFYVDGVYYARPAATAIDFVDLEQIEVLRGPQGTLFGKNTTAGAFNITTRPASFRPDANFEISYGNYGYIQAKGSITGPLVKDKLAARFSFSGTQRDGVIYSVRDDKYINDLNNLGFRGQLLYTPNDKIKITLAGDFARQRPNGSAQVIAGVVKTQRADYRQFDNIIKDLGYTLPSRNGFDRITDSDTPWKTNNDLGGVSLNLDARIGKGTLTSTTAWRYWKWDPSNDRDFTGLPILTKSQGNSKHQQLSQEIRYAGNIVDKLKATVGVFAIWQDLDSDPVQTEEVGSAEWRFAQNTTSALWKTPGLFDGYGINTTSSLTSFSGALFGQLDWSITEKLHLIGGLRFNRDSKDVDYKRVTYGGLQTTDPALLALKNSVYTNQEFSESVSENNFSGQLTVQYKVTKDINTFATFATSYKPIGVNVGGLPTDKGRVMTELATVDPESVTHYEIGIKSKPTQGSILNLTLYNTEIKDYQTQVQTAELGVNRGYLSNAEKVRVFGAELDGKIKVNNYFTLNASVAYTNGEYVKFTNAPVPLEEVGGTSAFKDVSGGDLPGISKWITSVGAEFTQEGNFLGLQGKYFIGLDSYYRTSFSSSPSPSQYLNIDGYALFNGRIGFNSEKGIGISIWSRNLFNKDYYEQLLPASGSAGQYAGVLGDPRTYGVTLKYSFKN